MADEDLNSKIMQIVGMLGKEKMPDGVASLISSFIDSAAKSSPKNQGGDSDNTGTQGPQDGASATAPQGTRADGDYRREAESVRYGRMETDRGDSSRGDSNRGDSSRGDSSRGGSNSDPDSNDETIRLLMTLIEGMRSTDDYRIKFLTSIRPLLSKRRQDKVSSCIQILKLARMSKTILNNSNNTENGEGM